ncbi:ESCRT-II subunit protein VPS25 [Spizellomyces punctatus DAOM BR117]|uniref:ESCRT-II complex subunit VPS25 n=1 Tax=Spizellomyces punctatus (strain DAOM BR117) TaxID=645134 RepID=A0A0L0HH68_SPIPD|nr:ESCRT-II subunit protein VPS25 [Spizellomyces punctatus DAOM BR117]KND00458.1 hypothetical protein SPPG_04776 [Spizellomyces punctatus DAOM BR117]|eukprot:XP_016608497.1 hypothetical protein SPPG_04776 [Spizellomyces punctatus DAOM BR117]
MSRSSYTFPSIHDFPPFYTLQPTAATQQKQIQLWCDILLAYCAATRTFSIDLGEIKGAGAKPKGAAEVFVNERLRRSLNREGIQTIIDALVNQGHAEWESSAKERCIVLWRKPEEWASLIYKWAFDTGSTNSICTVYELIHGEGTEGQDFHDLDERTMIKALEALSKTGKAQLFTGASHSEMGVKFF